jgi:hypothetical protein
VREQVKKEFEERLKAAERAIFEKKKAEEVTENGDSNGQVSKFIT